MKDKISKAAAKEKISEFFKKDSFSQDEMRKIKRLAMKYKIKLGVYRKEYCKKCLSELSGKTRIRDGFKSVKCEKCNYYNRWKIKLN